MKKILLILLAVIFTTASVFAKEIWYCPMHPNYISDRAGQCPICGMNLVKKQDKVESAHQDHPAQKVAGYAPVTIKEPMQQLMGLKTVEVQKKSLVKTIRASGIVDPNFQASKSARTFPIYAQISEIDIPLVQLGQKAAVEIPSFGQTIQGIVRYIDWKVDATTRTVSVRIDVKGVGFKLRGNMFVNVTIPVGSTDSLVIPRDSIMMTGTRAVVFVVSQNDSFHPQDIKTGLESEGLIQVKEGLQEGQKVVAGANFLLDSESRLQAALAGDTMQGLPAEVSNESIRTKEGAVHEQHN